MIQDTRVMLTMVTDEYPYRPGPREPFGIFVGTRQLAEARPHGEDGWRVFTRNPVGDFTALDAEADSPLAAVATQIEYAEEVVAAELAYLASNAAYRADRQARGLAY